MQQRKQSSSFLTILPPELRNNICERLLIHPHPIKITRGRSAASTRVLLDVCRQLKSEFSRLYYHGNVFAAQCSDSDLERELECTASLITWLRRIGARNRAVLREVQIRMVSRRTLTKGESFALLRDQNVRLAREVGWMSLDVLRVRVDEGVWVDQVELGEMIVQEEKEEEELLLFLTGGSSPKGPEITVWKRDVFDPVIDVHTKPGERRLSEFVCPATWRWHTRQDAMKDEVEREEEVVGCLSLGLKGLKAKAKKGARLKVRVRRGKTAVLNFFRFDDMVNGREMVG